MNTQTGTEPAQAIDVLIIDDNADNVRLLEGMLAAHAFTTATVRGCTDALRLARQYQPGLILLDVMKADGSGFNACEQLKADPATADIPVIFITTLDTRALDTSEHEERGFAAGAVDYLLKPFSATTVIARVRTHLELRRNHDQLEQQVALRTRTLNETLRELARGSRAKDDFLALISHELRTPLNGLSGSFGLLADEILDPKQRELLASARHSVSALNQIVENILLITEANAGTLKLVEWPFSLRYGLRAIMREIEPDILMKGLLFDFHIDDHVPDVYIGDPYQLLRALMQVLLNAVKFTPSGAISLRVTRATTNSSDDTTQDLIFAVSDTGVGIAPELQDKLFSLFTIGDMSLNRRHGGLGVGLALSHALLKLMQGSIRFDSQPTGGSIFTMTVPLHQAPAGTEIAIETIPGSLPVGRTVLIVEDNAINLMVERNIVEKLGLKVITAANGQEALDTLATQRADLILMDCQMPVMDGLEATRHIRSAPDALRNIPIIAVTANATSLDRERCFSVGMSDYLQKPVNPKHLEHKLAKWLLRSTV